MIKKEKGFTLVEVIVSVVLIIAVLFYLIRTIVVIGDKNSELVTRQEYSVFENNLLNSFYTEVDKKITGEKKLSGIKPDESNENTLHFLDLDEDLEFRLSDNTSKNEKLVFNSVVYALPNNVSFAQKDGKYYAVNYIDNIYDNSSMIVVNVFFKVANKDEMIKLTYQGEMDKEKGWIVTFHWNNTTEGKEEDTVRIPVRHQDTLDIENTDVGNYTNGEYAKEDGWYDDKENGTLVDFTKPIESNMDVYAHWSKKGFDIVFDKNSNNATGTMQAVNVPMNLSGGSDAKELPANEFKWTGHEFRGWNTEKNGTGYGCGDGGPFKSLTKAELKNIIENNDGKLTLYAQWVNTINEVNIKINMNGGSLASKHGSEYSTAGSYVTKNGSTIIHKIKWNNEIGGYGLANYNNDSAINIEKTGYKAVTGKEYYMTKDGTKKYFDHSISTYKAEDFCDASSNSCDAVLYVNWEPQIYTITLDRNCSNPSSESNITTKIYEKYNTGFYKSSGASSSDKMNVGAAKGISVPHCTGYTFKGYYNAKNAQYIASTGYLTSTASSKYFTANGTLTAQWAPITYTVKYNSNKPSTASTKISGSTASSTHTYNVAKNLTANGYSLSGYTFKGWNTKANGSGTTYSNKKSVKNLSSTAGATVNLYAQWKSNNYTVKFDCNGGSNPPSSQTATFDTVFKLTTKVCTRTGYTQNGWIRTSNNHVWTVANTNDKDWKWNINGNITLKARWTPNTYTVSFDCNGGSNPPSSQTATYDKSFSLTSKLCTRSGYKQTGWTRVSNNETWTSSNKSNITWKYTENVKLKAIWQQCPEKSVAVDSIYVRISGGHCDAYSSGYHYNNYTWYWNKKDGTSCSNVVNPVGADGNYCCKFIRYEKRAVCD